MSTTENQTEVRRLNKETIEDRKAIIGFIQDSEVSTYDIAKFMNYDKTKCHNMLRAMEEDNIIMKSGTADAHPSGRGRPPHMWKLVDAELFASMHKSPNNTNSSEGKPDNNEELTANSSTDEDTAPESNGEAQASELSMSAKISEKVNRALYGGNRKPTSTSVKTTTPKKIAQSETDATPTVASAHTPRKEPTPKPKKAKVVEESTTMSQKTAPVMSIMGVQTILVDEDNLWVHATAANIAKFSANLGDGSMGAIDVPLNCVDIDAYIKEHEDDIAYEPEMV